jgi:Probable zinc-ribbon domain
MFQQKNKGAKATDCPTAHSVDDFRSYVEHPRFGRGPRMTGLNPTERFNSSNLVAHWHSPPEQRIPHTAIAANMSQQVLATMNVQYYFDVRRRCRDCGRKFIFFAEEQRHWYEELKFNLEADCVHCCECRRKQHSSERIRERYNDLVTRQPSSAFECLELAAASVELLQSGAFCAHPTTFSRVRMWLNRVSNDTAFDADRLRVLNQLKMLEAAFSVEAHRGIQKLNSEPRIE